MPMIDVLYMNSHSFAFYSYPLWRLRLKISRLGA